MKYLALLLFPALTSCISPDAPIVTQPVGDTLGQVVAAAPDIAAQVATGQYWAAGLTATGLIGSLLGWKGYQKVKASGPGTLGILAPKAKS